MQYDPTSGLNPAQQNAVNGNGMFPVNPGQGFPAMQAAFNGGQYPPQVQALGGLYSQQPRQFAAPVQPGVAQPGIPGQQQNNMKLQNQLAALQAYYAQQQQAQAAMRVNGPVVQGTPQPVLNAQPLAGDQPVNPNQVAAPVQPGLQQPGMQNQMQNFGRDANNSGSGYGGGVAGLANLYRMR